MRSPRVKRGSTYKSVCVRVKDVSRDRERTSEPRDGKNKTEKSKETEEHKKALEGGRLGPSWLSI